MNPINQIIAEGKRLCEGATQGEWDYGYWSGQCKMNHVHGRSVCKYEYSLVKEGTNLVLKDDPITLCTSTDEYVALSEDNAAFIAHHNPSQMKHIYETLERAIEVIKFYGDKEGYGVHRVDNWAPIIGEAIREEGKHAREFLASIEKRGEE